MSSRSSSPGSPGFNNSFPKYIDGDVLIKSGTGRSWKLHSTTIMGCSKTLAAMLSADTVTFKLSKKDRDDGKTIKWILDMIPWEERQQDTRFRSFELQTSKKSRQVPSFGAVFEGQGIAGPNNLPYNKTYDNLFRCMYNIPPVFASDKDENGAYFILDAISLLQAAESLRAARCVRIVVESYLLRLGKTLWFHIERHPETWADIAIRLESPGIFREAITHLVGRFDLRGSVDKSFLAEQENGEFILEMCTRKAAELQNRKLRVERRLIEFFPPKMIHIDTEGEIAGRAVYSTDIYLWQAIVIVRQYLTSAYISNFHHSCADGGINFYRCISQGRESYLRDDTLERFHESFGMSTKGKQCLQVAVDFVKEQLKPIVELLLEDKTQIVRGKTEPRLPYLTCMSVEHEELPWVIRAVKREKKIAEEAKKAEETARRRAAEDNADNMLQFEDDDMNH